MLKGYRTYICCAVIAIASAVKYLGYITPDQYDAIIGFVGAGGLAALRAAK